MSVMSRAAANEEHSASDGAGLRPSDHEPRAECHHAGCEATDDLAVLIKIAHCHGVAQSDEGAR